MFKFSSQINSSYAYIQSSYSVVLIWKAKWTSVIRTQAKEVKQLFWKKAVIKGQNWDEKWYGLPGAVSGIEFGFKVVCTWLICFMNLSETSLSFRMVSIFIFWVSKKRNSIPKLTSFSISLFCCELHYNTIYIFY